MADHRLVLAEWVDSTSGGEWGKLPDKEPDPLVCRSVGWLVVDGEKVKIVVPHMHDEDEALGCRKSGCGDMTIPTCAVTRIVDLQEV